MNMGLCPRKKTGIETDLAEIAASASNRAGVTVEAPECYLTVGRPFAQAFINAAKAILEPLRGNPAVHAEIRAELLELGKRYDTKMASDSV